MKKNHAVGILVIAGLFLIAAGELYLQPAVRPIDTITEADIGDTVTVHGVVKEVVKHDSIDILTYERRDIPVIDFDKRLQKEMEGSEVTVTGTVELYQGELEILVSKIS